MVLFKSATVSELLEEIGKLTQKVEAAGFVFLPHNLRVTPSELDALHSQLLVVTEVVEDPDVMGSTIPEEYATNLRWLGGLSDAFRKWGFDFHKSDPEIPDSLVVLVMIEAIKRMAAGKLLKLS